MLIFDLKVVGNKLYEIRTKKLMSRAEVAEKANISERTYADIERGSVNMRIETALNICRSLGITPNDIFTEKNTDLYELEKDILNQLRSCSDKEKETALRFLDVYFHSIK